MLNSSYTRVIEGAKAEYYSERAALILSYSDTSGIPLRKRKTGLKRNQTMINILKSKNIDIDTVELQLITVDNYDLSKKYSEQDKDFIYESDMDTNGEEEINEYSRFKVWCFI